MNSKPFQGLTPGGAGRDYVASIEHRDHPRGYKSGRWERANNIRCDLLVDRDSGDEKLGLIDASGFVSERVLAEHQGGSRLPTRDALAALVARRLLSVVPGKGYEVALVTREVLERNQQAGYNSINGLRAELERTGNAAIESISSASTEHRCSLLREAKGELECAAEKSSSNLVRDRGEAVFRTTEAIGLIGSAAGLRWGADTLRSGLDIFEISTRWNSDQRNREVFEGPEVTKRVKKCKLLLDALTGSGEITNSANKAFSGYLDDRVRELSIAVD